MGSLILPFWTSGEVSSGFQSHSGQPHSRLAEAYVLQTGHSSLRFTLFHSYTVKFCLIIEWSSNKPKKGCCGEIHGRILCISGIRKD